MSRTDKTRPYWVQMRDPGFPYVLRAHHRHHGTLWRERGCDLDFPMPIPRGRRDWANCEWWPKYRDYGKLWGRTNWRRNHPGHDGRARAALRMARIDWRKTAPRDRGDIDSGRDAPTRRWLWRAWYWD